MSTSVLYMSMSLDGFIDLIRIFDAPGVTHLRYRVQSVDADRKQPEAAAGQPN